MPNSQVQCQAELFFRLHLHAVLPMHAALVDELCGSTAPPLELATVLEDIGQGYLQMAQALNGELIRRGRLEDEPEDYEDFDESRIGRFADDLVASADAIEFADGTRLDARAALEMSPFVRQAIRVAMLLARSRKFPNGAGHGGRPAHV